jgi:uncharacterized protein (TIGR03435 family)
VANVSSDVGTYSAENHSVRQLIRQAYGLKDIQVAGGPNWIGDNSREKFDIVAKASDRVARGQLMLMLQVLLEDRFKLKFHNETRQMPVYMLVVAKPGTPAAGLHPPTPTGPPRSPVRGPLSDLVGQNATMEDLASYLSGADGRLVVDETGLTKHYDFTLESALGPDDPRQQLKGLKLNLPPENRPSLVEALREQLGLKLESARGPVPIMIIDSVERPSEN